MATPVEGEGLSGAADTGRAPVKVGAVYVATPAAQTDGNRVNLITDDRQNLRIAIRDGLNAANVAGFAADARAAANGLTVITQNQGFNNSTYDRLRTSSAANLALQSGLGVSMASL